MLKGRKEHKDENGEVKQEFRRFLLRTLMGNCADFQEEKSAMEVLLEELSTKTKNNQTLKLLTSPKYHCELAGEGIEYAWGLSKRFYRNKCLEDKNTKSKFDNVVRQAIEFVSKKNINNFSARCRRYMMAYMDFKKNNKKLTYESIERFMKMSKTHRNIADSEKGFIEAAWLDSISL